MDAKTLEAIEKEASEYHRKVTMSYHTSDEERAYIDGAQSKAARDYWIKWAFEKAREMELKTSNEHGMRIIDNFNKYTLPDLITLADKETKND